MWGNETWAARDFDRPERRDRAGGTHRRGRDARVLHRALAVLLLTPLLVVQTVASSAPAAAAVVGGFEIDGNTADDPGTTGLDWDSLTGAFTSDPVGSLDVSNFTEGSKEFEHPANWVYGTGTAPAQDDISGVYSYVNDDDPANVWAFFGFKRFATSGTTNYDVEYNQRENSSIDPARPTRSRGDLMLRFEQDGGASFVLTSAFLWTLQTDARWLAAATSTTKADDCIPVSGYNPAAGWCPISTGSTGFVGETSADGTFAEGAVNISQIFASAGATDCRGAFGTMNIRSFTGESTQSALKDYVRPIAVSVPPTCWQPLSLTNAADASYDVAYDWSVQKTVDRTSAEVPEGTSATFDYRVTLTAGDEQVSGREISGTATITNPNTEMVATLAVAVNGAQACTMTGLTDARPATPGFQVLVPRGSTELDYTCDVATSPAPSGTVTATVSWDPTTYPQDPTTTPPPTYTRSAADGYTYEVTSTDEQTTVNDTFNGGTPEPLGTFTWADVYNETNPNTPPHTVVVRTYQRTIPGVAGECNDYDNVARQTENDSGRSTTSEQTVTVCVASDLVIDKVAGLSYNRAYEWDIAKTGPGTVFVGEDGNGDFVKRVTYTVDLTATRYTDSDRLVGGNVLVSNPNEWSVNATLSDTVTVDGVALDCTFTGTDADPATPVFDVVVPGGADRLAFPYTCPNPDQGPYAGTNTATLDWAPGTHVYPDADTSVSKTVAVNVTADASPTDKTVTLTDRLEGAVVPLPQSTFDWDDVYAMTADEASGKPAHTQRLTYTRDLSTTRGACSTYRNVVTIDLEGTDESDGHTVEVCAPGVTKTVVADFGRKQLWDLTKEVDRTTVEISAGGVATFNYTVKATPTQVVDDGTASWTGTVSVTNPSANESLTVDVTDAPDVGDWTCTFDGDASQRTIAKGQTLDLDYTCTGTGHPTGENTAVVDFGSEQVSTTVGVTFRARTAVADSVVTIRDDKTDSDTVPVPVLFTADASDSETWSHRYPLTKTGVAGVCTPYTNTAVLDLTATSPDPSDSQQVTVCVEKPLVVTKTAAGTFARDYDWLVAKTSSAPEATVPEGSTHEFPYTVTATPDGYRDSAWEVHGTITVKNPNTYTAGGIAATVSDRLSGITGATCTVTDPAIQLAPGAETTLSYSCTLDPTGEDYTGTNVATATWAPAPTYVPARPESPNPESASASSAEVPVTLTLPAGNVTDFTVPVYDDPQGPTGPDRLGTATWGATLGTTTPGAPTVFNYDGVARAGQAGTCTPYDNKAWVDQAVGTDPEATETVELCVAKDLTVFKSVAVAYDRLYNWSLAKSGPGTVFVGDDSTGSATYDITVKAEQPTDSDVSVVGTITITNPNDFQDVVADVTDTFTLDGVETDCDVTGGPEGDGQDVVVPKGGSLPLGYTCELDEGTWPEDYRGSNEVTVTWDAETYTTPTGEATHTNAVDAPEVTETPAMRTITLADEITEAGGDPATVTIPEAYQELTWDEVHGEVGNEVTFQVTVELTPDLEADACTTYTNVVSIVDSTVGPGSATTEVCRPAISKDEDARFGRDYKWLIDKAADRTEVEVGPGGRPTFTYTVVVTPDGFTDATPTWSGTISVTNPSATTPLTVDVSDLPNKATWTCAVDGETTIEVAEGTTETVGYTCTPSEDAARQDVENTARAAFGDGERVQATIPVSFTEVPTNDTITVTDPKAPNGGVLGTATWSEGQKTFRYPWTAPVSVAGECTDYDNTATITETGQDSTETVEVCVEAPLTAAAQASADLARAYAWSVDKVADATERTVDAGGNAIFRYTVTARAGAATDSGWRLSGTVTLTNPNTYEEGAITLTGATVTTDLGGGSSCTAPLPDPPVVPAGSGEAPGTLTVPFSCTFTGQPAGSGTVSTAVTWDPPGEDDTESATADRAVSFAVRSETNKVVDVVDDKTVAGQRTLLESGVVWAAGLVRTYTYDLTLRGGAAGTCQTYTNTAVVDLPVGADPVDTAQVRVCAPPPEVLPAQSFGKARGAVRATCQGTVTARMRNNTDERVTYVLRIGKKVHRIKVRSESRRLFQTKGPFRARVVLRAQGRVLDRTRVPRACLPPQVLPSTGLRTAAQARATYLAARWR